MDDITQLVGQLGPTGAIVAVGAFLALRVPQALERVHEALGELRERVARVEARLETWRPRHP